jgi:hypothetical protein
LTSTGRRRRAAGQDRPHVRGLLEPRPHARGLRDAPAAVVARLRALAETADAVRSAREQLPMELRELLETAVKGAAAHAMAGGPIEPDAPNVARPDRPLP